MLGLFKKKVTPGEFGHAALHLAGEFLFADAGRSLAMRFEDFDGSKGWTNFLERQGVPIPAQRLYNRLFAHCAFQAACTGFNYSTSRDVTEGAAIASFADKPDGYDFGTTYNTLQSAYHGHHTFDTRVVLLSNFHAQLDNLRLPNAGVINAKYLIESFIIPNMKNSNSFIDEFESYSGTMCAAVATVSRAIDYQLNSLKII